MENRKKFFIAKREMDSIRQEALAFAAIGMYRYKFDGTILFMDLEALRILDLEEVYPDPSMVSGKNIADLIIYSTPKGWLRHIIREHGHIKNFEYAYKTLSGHDKWVVHDSYIVKDPKTNEEAIQVIIRDITVQKLAEEALKQSEEKFKILSETTGAAIFIYEGTKFLYVNSPMEKLTGYIKEELLNMDFYDLIHSDFKDMLKERGIARKKGENVLSRYEFKTITKDGKDLWVDFTTGNIEYKGKLAAIGTAFDITERKLMEEALKQSEEKFRTLAETAHAAIFIFQGEKFRYVNPGMEVLIGYSKDELLNMNFWNIAHPDHTEIIKQRGLARLRGELGPSRREFKFLSKSGEEKWVEANAANVQFEGKPAAIVIAFDITERKATVEALRYSEEKFRTLAETTKAAIFIYQGNKFRYVNPSMEMLTGFNIDELMNMNFWDIAHPDFKELMKERGLARQEGKSVISRYELKILTKYGDVRWLDFQAGNIEYEKKLAVIGTALDITQRKNAESVLVSTKARLEYLLTFSPAAIYSCELTEDYAVTFISESCKTLFGYNPDEFLNNPKIWQENLHPEDAPRVLAQLSSISEQEHQKHEYRFRHKDGAYRWILDELRLVRGADGAPKEIVGFVKDISDRKRAEEELLLSEARSRALLNAIPDMMFQIRRDGIFIDYKAPKEDLLYVPPKEFIGKTIHDVLPSYLAQKTMHHMELAFQTGEIQIYEYELNFSDGKKGVYEARLLASGENDVIAIIRDITELKRVEEAERKRTEQLIAFQSALLDLSIMDLTDLESSFNKITEIDSKTLDVERVGIWLYSENHTEITCEDLYKKKDNSHEKGLRLYYGMYPDYFMALEGSRILAADDARIDPRTSEFTESYLIPFGITSMMDVPVRLHGEVVAIVCHEHTGVKRNWIPEEQEFAASVAHIVSLALETAERLKAEAEIRRLKDELEQRVIDRTKQLEIANKELEAFSYSVSHDLRAPLRAIDGFSRILNEECAHQLPAQAQHYLNIMQTSTHQMATLIDDLLAFSRLSRQSLKKITVQPEDLVRQVLDERSAEQKDRRIEIVINEMPPCEADPFLLKQVFDNLLSNALKFTQNNEVARIEVGCRQEGGKHIYYVKDNGVGFDMQYYDKIFGVFQRLHRSDDYEGTGVGLAIVQRIINRHNGRIWANAEVNKGAEFYFTLAEGVLDDH